MSSEGDVKDFKLWTSRAGDIQREWEQLQGLWAFCDRFFLPTSRDQNDGKNLKDSTPEWR